MVGGEMPLNQAIVETALPESQVKETKGKAAKGKGKGKDKDKKGESKEELQPIVVIVKPTP